MFHFRSHITELYKISFLWYSVIGALISVIIGVIISSIVNKLSGKLIMSGLVPQDVCVTCTDVLKMIILQFSFILITGILLNKVFFIHNHKETCFSIWQLHFL